MRNYTWTVIGIGLLLFYFFYVGIWKPDYVVRSESAWGDLMLMGLAGLYLAMWSMMVGKKHSDKAIGKAFCTDLMDTRPLDEVKIPHPKDPTKEFTFALYPMNGNKPFMSRGGRTSGLFVVNEELIEVWTGDYTNLVFDAPYEIYREKPRKGERDITCLPMEIYDMVLQSEYYHKKGAVLLFADPGRSDARRKSDPLTGLPYKDLYDSVNKANKSLLDDLDRVIETSSKLSSANLKNARSYAGEDRSRFDRRERNPPEREEYRDEER